jgi:hypothetical protein
MAAPPLEVEQSVSRKMSKEYILYVGQEASFQTRAMYMCLDDVRNEPLLQMEYDLLIQDAEKDKVVDGTHLN